MLNTGEVSIAVCSGVTLPNKSTELLNCVCNGPTSFKSLGTLFILSFNNVINAVVFSGSGYGPTVSPGYPLIIPGKYIL